MGRDPRDVAPMKSVSRLAFLVLVLVGWSCGAQAVVDPPTVASPPLLLISMDGFRWDYAALHREETPNLQRLLHEGVSARGLIPAFPSNTFPNHYSIVTGLYPSHHGIVNNEFFDPRFGTFFRYNNPALVSESRWWGGEPIWITAVQHERKAGVSFWVGSEAEIHGKRPTFWRRFDLKLSFDKRLDEISRWLSLPEAERPQFFVVYLEEANSVGHKFGPDSPEMVDTIRMLDSRVGQLLERFRITGVEPNVVIVSDHGMTEISKDRVIILDRFGHYTATGPRSSKRWRDSATPKPIW
jgi:predicted AlkP superfamily pyrophosphatase or phosphodiesterase